MIRIVIRDDHSLAPACIGNDTLLQSDGGIRCSSTMSFVEDRCVVLVHQPF